MRDFAYTGPAVPIPDNNAAGVSIPLAVSGVGNLSKATFSIDGTQCVDTSPVPTVGLEHTFVGDQVGTLVAPDGTTVSLFNRLGHNFNGGNNFCQAVFDDSAARSIESATTEEDPFAGSWRPASPLSDLVSHPADGTWLFKVSDRAGADVGSVRAFSLHLSGFAA